MTVTTNRHAPATRDSYRAFRTITTRWMDNDPYGHMNNVVHYSLFDTAVNGWLIEQGDVIPIPGAKNGRQAAANAEALTFRLPPDETEALTRATLAWR